MTAILGVDVGGTFSDFVRWDGSTLATGKLPTTTDDQSVAVVDGARRLGDVVRFLHGTTVATNALLERRGAVTALVTSAGFGDVVEIARQNRPALYDAFADRPDPLVPAGLRFEVGDEPTHWVVPPQLATADAVAVALLYGFERTGAESAVAATLTEALGRSVAMSLSSDVVPEFREYERTITTVVNAYLAPETGRYLQRLVERCRRAGVPDDVLVMRSSGGLIPIAEAARLPAAILLSGPAGGVMAAAALGHATGRDSLISFDMGGTSTDVCRIEDSRPEVSYEREIAGYPCRLPSVAIHTVGAGGGSIAWGDTGGALRVGPRSAGADPGPAAYGKGGTEPTVSDANVVLGRIPADALLAGDLPIRGDLARAAVAQLGRTLSLGAVETAVGIATVVEEVMAGAIRKVSLEEGADPRHATLVAFGGAGGLHATALARRLDMAGVLVPLHAGVFSALGLLLSPPRVDLARSLVLRESGAARLDPALVELEVAATEQLVSRVGVEAVRTEIRVDVRYLGQAHELALVYTIGAGWSALAEDFHHEHRLRNGFARPDDPIEVVTLRVAATGPAALDFGDIPVPSPAGEVVAGERSIVAGDDVVTATIVRRAGLGPGAEVVGPAIIEESEATTYLAPGERAVVLSSGALEIEW